MKLIYKITFDSNYLLRFECLLATETGFKGRRKFRTQRRPCCAGKVYLVEIELFSSEKPVKLFVLNGPGQYYPIDNRKKSEKVEDETRCSFV